ncbi:unnamed protein product [Onchocerca flexuosa]|uniref:Uncharacterized protein n=1 Tax=Onchocerca flexuosa TaxID=387005 RepID=A0A183H8W5_9BILA|nr:unnamed protein product [Onchocerca flexuosa]
MLGRSELFITMAGAKISFYCLKHLSSTRKFESFENFMSQHFYGDLNATVFRFSRALEYIRMVYKMGYYLGCAVNSRKDEVINHKDTIWGEYFRFVV